MTGCGCFLLFALLAVLLYLFVFGSTDAGEPIESAAALAVLVLARSSARFHPRWLYAVTAIAGRRALHAVARS